MRSYKHITPRYIVDRLSEMYYQKKNPTLPWLTKTANAILDTYLKKSDVGVEFGSGRSTIWMAQKISFLTSVEHSADWYHTVRNTLEEKEIKNVEYIHHDCVEEDAAGGFDSAYVRTLDKFGPSSLDFIFIDGIYRAACAIGAIDKLAAGGLLLLDNVNIYLPSDSISPNSRSMLQGAINRPWKDFQERIKNWRYIWTTSGVTDTAFYFKPYAL